MANIKFFALGGLGENGKNMYVVEVNERIFVLDAGLKYPDIDMYGVDAVIADISYLIENKNRIEGVFISHGHEDHIGALPFLLGKVKIPVIYASGIARTLISNKMMEFPDINYNMKSFDSNTELTYKNFKVSFFRTNHSIPDNHTYRYRYHLP